MIIPPNILLPIEILLNALINEHFQTSFCLTFVTATDLSVKLPSNMSYMRIVPNHNDSDLVKQILDVSEKGCSDYIVQMRKPEKFMIAFEKVNHIGDARRSDKKLIFLPFKDDLYNTSLTDLLTLKETEFVANMLLIIPSAQSSDDCNVFDIITHTFVGSDEEIQKPLYLNSWDSCTGEFEKTVNLFPHDMSNLYGKTVKVAAFTYKPYVLLDLDPSLNPLGRDGMEMRIIDEFCRWINCTVEIIRDDEHEWGEIYDNNTGVGVIGNVVEDRADIGINDCNVFDIITHTFVGSDEEIQKPLYLNSWDSCTGEFEKTVNLFPHDMSNLYGKTVKVAAFTYKPYVLLDLDPSLNPLGRDGMEMRIIDEFCRWINCTVEIIRDDEHEWGEIYDNNTGVGVIGNVVEDRADIGITALYSWYEEYKVLDFSAPIIRTAITCVAPAPRILTSWDLPLVPFTWPMWLCLVIVFFYASFARFIAKRSSDNIFLDTFGMMITQTREDASPSWRIRSITGWILLTGLIIDNAYSGGLASSFTVPKYEPSIDTLEDLVDRGMEWGATHDAWIFSIMLSEEPLIKRLLSQFKTYPSDTLKRKSFTRSMAFSIEHLPAGYFAIGEYITKDAAMDLEIMLDKIYYEQCVVMMRKSSPYTAKLSKLVGRLHQSGLMLSWETQMCVNEITSSQFISFRDADVGKEEVVSYKRVESLVALKYLNFKVQLEVRLSRGRKDLDEAKPLSIKKLLGIYIFYFGGVAIALLVFFGELLSKCGKASIVM